MADIDELNEKITKIVSKEIDRIVDLDELSFTDTKQLELYARILNSKSKKEQTSQFGNLSTEELLKLVNGTPEPDPLDIVKNAPLAPDADDDE